MQVKPEPPKTAQVSTSGRRSQNTHTLRRNITNHRFNSFCSFPRYQLNNAAWHTQRSDLFRNPKQLLFSATAAQTVQNEGDFSFHAASSVISRHAFSK